MIAIKRTFNGHDFTFGTCVCGLTKDEYDDSGQPPCAGPLEPVPGTQGARATSPGALSATSRKHVSGDRQSTSLRIWN